MTARLRNEEIFAGLWLCTVQVFIVRSGGVQDELKDNVKQLEKEHYPVVLLEMAKDNGVERQESSKELGKNGENYDHVDESASASPSTTDPPHTHGVEELKAVEAKALFPSLQNSTPPDDGFSGRPGTASTAVDDGTDQESAVAEPFERNTNPEPNFKRNQGAVYEKVGDHGVSKMHKFTLYETTVKYYVVGADIMDKRFRVLKIDRDSDAGTLNIAEDEIVYTKKEMAQLLNAIDDGNKSTGGLKLKCTTWGLLGFIRFTGAYYMLVITKRSQVAMIGGHYIYQIDGTELVPLTSSQSSRFKPDLRNAEEARFLGILNNLDLSRSFYYSYSYDITRTLQSNMMRERDALAKNAPYAHPPEYNGMFVWNEYLLQPADKALKNTFDWCLPIIHGYIDQAALSIYGRSINITIIARRSRYFAGARFLKRGANDLGYVANDVETEQIVSDSLTTSFHAPGPKLFANPNYTSYVQHRGSIPLYWTQDNTGVTPKPPIELNLVDPFYGAAALHFDNLFERYGASIYVLNLVKAKERTPRESKLLVEFSKAIEYLNQFLPQDKKIIHKAWDMGRASKSHDQDVIGTLESIGEEVVLKTGFFRNGDGEDVIPSMQNGIARTNCIDCLDRTNAAQFVIGKRALGHQLHALGVTGDTSIDYDTDAVNLFTHMYHDHGDTIAIQYGGSQLVNTMETYRKINQWTSHSRDMVESFKRYYNNSFLDGQRQEAYNLFLGNYIFVKGQPMLWDLANDYYLHHADPRSWSKEKRRNYINWYTPEFLKERKLVTFVSPSSDTTTKPLEFFDDYWLEYYKPLALSSLLKVFSYKMNSTLRYIPVRSTLEGRYDLSPFKVRTEADQDVPRKRVTINEVPQEPSKPKTPPENEMESVKSSATGAASATKKISIQRWLQPINDKPHGIVKEARPVVPESPRSKQKLTPLDKSKAAQWTFTQVVNESLNPSVSNQEADDYARYISHPQTLPLVVSTALPTSIDSEYLEYVNGDWQQVLEPLHVSRHDMAEYAQFLVVTDNALTVTEEDASKKRFKTYRKWMGGKSLFKQQPVDLEEANEAIRTAF